MGIYFVDNYNSEAFYQSIFDNAPSGLAYCQMIFDQQGKPSDCIYLKANRIFAQLMGLTAVNGEKASEANPAINVSNPELLMLYGRVATTGKTESVEAFVKPLNKWFFIYAYSQKKNFFVTLWLDINDQKQMDKSVAEAQTACQNMLRDLSIEKAKVEIAEAKEKAALAAIGDGLLSTDQEGKFVFINNAAEKLLGLKNEEVIGKNFCDVVSLENEPGIPIPLAQRPLNLVLSTQDAIVAATDSDYYYVRKDKSRFPVAINVAPIILNGKVTGTIEIFRDVTLEKEVSQAKTEFVSLASHQLRTPLSTIGWYLEMLLGGDVGELNEKQKQYLDEAHHSAQHMMELVNALLNVSRLELGIFSIETEPSDVATLVEKEIDEQRVQIDEKKIKIIPTIARNVPLIPIDVKLLSMVIQNILSNAVKYTPENGEIKVSLQLAKCGEAVGRQTISEDSIVITISDTGRGIPADQQDKIFTKFFRADNVSQKGDSGTGLGLYIAKSIIDHAGGTIRFESKEGEGTTFYVTLPLTGMRKKQGTKKLK